MYLTKRTALILTACDAVVYGAVGFFLGWWLT